MKKALILTASFGGGHNKAANNIKEKLEQRGFDVEEIDLLKEISKAFLLYRFFSLPQEYSPRLKFIRGRVDTVILKIRQTGARTFPPAQRPPPFRPVNIEFFPPGLVF